MDKRSLIFFVCLAAAFFLINWWFGTQKDDQQREIIHRQAAQKKERVERLKVEAKQRTASLYNLPVVELYSDEEGKNFAAYAVQIEGGFISIAWQSKIPEELYIKERRGFQRLTALFQPSHSQEPVIYSGDKNLKVTLPHFPIDADFQIVCLTCVDREPQIFFGEYQDGTLTVPLGPISDNSIALFEKQGHYYPVGIYEAKSEHLRPLKDYLKFKNIVEIEKPAAITVENKGSEEFYVLENKTQQLVFSNLGGALVEINLPLRSSENKKSVVLPIEPDKIIQEKYPQNDYFPQHSYHVASSSETISPTEGGYYPLLRRSIYDSKGQAETEVPPRFYGMNIISEDNTEDLVYRVTHFEENLIEFEASEPHRRITKTFSFPEEKDGVVAPYTFDLRVRVEGDTRGLWLNSGVPEVELISGNYSPSLKYRISRGKKSSVEKAKLPDPSVIVSSIYPDWVCSSNGFFGVILDPLTEIGAGYEARKIDGIVIPTRLTLIDPQYKLYPASKYPGYEILLPLKNSSQTMQFRIFAGPFEDSILKLVDQIYSDPVSGYNPDYIGAQSFHGWFSFISEPFAKLLFLIMQFFHTLTHSWGFSIILLTVVLRLMLYPLNAWSIRSTQRMQNLAPKVKELQNKYKKDPKKAQIEIMSLYREKGANPFMGCFPILIQMPFLIGMFDLLKSTFQLRGACFIPGWITNLTAPDVLFTWNYPIFFIGTEFHLLPILLGLIMYVQQRLTSKAPKDKSQWTDQQKQQRTTGNIMVVVFTVLFYKFPSGLNIYWLSSTVLGILQQWYMTSRVKKKSEVIVQVPRK